MKNYDELCSAAEAAVWLELEKYLPEKGTITTFMYNGSVVKTQI